MLTRTAFVLCLLIPAAMAETGCRSRGSYTTNCSHCKVKIPWKKSEGLYTCKSCKKWLVRKDCRKCGQKVSSLVLLDPVIDGCSKCKSHWYLVPCWSCHKITKIPHKLKDWNVPRMPIKCRHCGKWPGGKLACSKCKGKFHVVGKTPTAQCPHCRERMKAHWCPHCDWLNFPQNPNKWKCSLCQKEVKEGPRPQPAKKITLNCPHCKKNQSIEHTYGDHPCPSCRKLIFLVQCPFCATEYVVGTPSEYHCKKDKKNFGVARCPFCQLGQEVKNFVGAHKCVDCRMPFYVFFCPECGYAVHIGKYQSPVKCTSCKKMVKVPKK